MHTLARIVPALLAAALWALAPATARAQDAQDLPSAESLFEAHIQGIGGREALEKQHDRTMYATYKIIPTGEVQVLTVYQQAPNSLRAELDAPALGTTTRATDGEHTWGTNNSGSPFDITGREKLELLDSAPFMGEADYQKTYTSIKTVGSAMIANRPTYRVDFVTTSGLEGAVYFDKETKLVAARQVFSAVRNDPSALVAVSEYKEFEGIKLPTRQIQLMGDDLKPAVEIVFKWVYINTGKTPEFAPPDSLISSVSQDD